MLEYVVILIGILDPHATSDSYTPTWGTAFATYNTLEDCRAELADTAHLYRMEWPDAVFDCFVPTATLPPMAVCKDSLQCHLRSRLVPQYQSTRAVLR